MVGVLEELAPGEYSHAAVFTDERGKKGVRLLYLISKTEPHRENLKDDYGKIANRALEYKKEAHLEKWFRKNASGFYIQIDKQYRNCAQLNFLSINP
jgi:peptidyl-prolyl cis-trans isomerase SurA